MNPETGYQPEETPNKEVVNEEESGQINKPLDQQYEWRHDPARPSLKDKAFKSFVSPNALKNASYGFEYDLTSAIRNTPQEFYTTERVLEIIDLVDSRLYYKTDLQVAVTNTLHRMGLLTDEIWTSILRKSSLSNGRFLEKLSIVPQLPKDTIKDLIFVKTPAIIGGAMEFNYYRIRGLMRFTDFKEGDFTEADAWNLISEGNKDLDNVEGIKFTALHLQKLMDRENRGKFFKEVIDLIETNFVAHKKEKLSDQDYVKYVEMQGYDLEKFITTPNEESRWLVTQHYDSITDDQWLQLLECGHFSRNGLKEWEHIPGWVLYGEKILYGIHESDRKIIEDRIKPGLTEKYELVEKKYLKEPLPEISKEQISKIVAEVKELGMKRYEPVVPKSKPSKSDVYCVHISGRSDLNVLLQQRSRKTDRSAHDLAIYIQRGGEYDRWQMDFLNKVNDYNLHKYEFYLSERQLRKYFYPDDRWDRGYATDHPILLDGTKELTWEMFNKSMVDNVIDLYERDMGPIPLQAKEELIADTFGHA